MQEFTAKFPEFSRDEQFIRGHFMQRLETLKRAINVSIADAQGEGASAREERLSRRSERRARVSETGLTSMYYHLILL